MDQRRPVLYDYQHNDEFCAPASREVIDAPMPDYETWLAKKSATRVPAGTPPELVYAYRWPLLTGEQERHLFRRLNYHKYCYNVLVQQRPPGCAAMPEHCARLEHEANVVHEVETILFNCNVRLVINVVKRKMPPERFWEALSDGNLALLHCIAKYNYATVAYNKTAKRWGPVKFSTYATYGIVRTIRQLAAREAARADRFVTGLDDWLLTVADRHSADGDVISSDDRRRFYDLLDALEPRERTIIKLRNGLGANSPRGAEIWTLEEVGAQLGITRERVRQLNIIAMRKLRAAAVTGVKLQRKRRKKAARGKPGAQVSVKG